MIGLRALLLIVAVVLFLFATFGVPSTHVAWIPLGLASFAGSFLAKS